MLTKAKRKKVIDIKPHNFFGQLFDQFLMKFDHEQRKIF